MHKYIVTGASGLVARFVIDALSKNDDNLIFAASSNISNIFDKYSKFDNVKCIDNQQISYFLGGGNNTLCFYAY